MSKKLYIAVTPDEYELPLFVADSLTEMANHFGKNIYTVSSAISLNNSGVKCGMKFLKVIVDEQIS